MTDTILGLLWILTYGSFIIGCLVGIMSVVVSYIIIKAADEMVIRARQRKQRKPDKRWRW